VSYIKNFSHYIFFEIAVANLIVLYTIIYTALNVRKVLGQIPIKLTEEDYK
jgi:hypothetical protein